MRITKEISLREFDFWGGGKDTADVLSYEDLDLIESSIGNISGYEAEEHITESDINDLFWHDSDSIAQLLGYDTWEDLENTREAEMNEESDRDDVVVYNEVLTGGVYLRLP